MQISRLEVVNYRSIEHDALHCGRMVALVGPNGSGKSAWLRALALFYDPSGSVEVDDYYNRSVAHAIEISVTFGNLTDAAVELFDKYVEDRTLTVTKVINWNEGRPRGTYHGSTLQNPEFERMRSALLQRDRAKTARDELSKLRAIPKYASLPDWTTIESAKESLRSWEEQHPDACQRIRDEGQFFGFTEVAAGYLGKFTRLLLIPAVRDVMRDVSESKASVFTQLLDLVIRSVLARRGDIAALEQDVNTRYENLLSVGANDDLSLLQEDLTIGLRVFVPQAHVELEWQEVAPVSLPLPTARVRLVEDDFPSSVDRCGHGLQRTFALVMLQRLAQAQLAITTQTDQRLATIPNLVLAIEEPELFQHPNRQRHFANVLRQVATGATPGVAEATQVIYATHSPLFVGIDRLDDIRLMSKDTPSGSGPRVTKALSITLDEVAAELQSAQADPGTRFTGETLRPRLQALMTPWMNEGFFAQRVVLVEGEEDRAAISGMAEMLGVDLESVGISVLPCAGKTNIDRPLVIFRRFGISVYPVWDGDSHVKDPNPAPNRSLLRLVGAPVEDWPEHCGPSYTCFRESLARTLRAEVGEDLYNELLAQVGSEFGYFRPKHAEKNPHIVADLIRRAEGAGRPCQTLRAIIGHILAQSPVLPPEGPAGEPEPRSPEAEANGQFTLLV